MYRWEDNLPSRESVWLLKYSSSTVKYRSSVEFNSVWSRSRTKISFLRCNNSFISLLRIRLISSLLSLSSYKIIRWSIFLSHHLIYQQTTSCWYFSRHAKLKSKANVVSILPTVNKYNWRENIYISNISSFMEIFSLFLFSLFFKKLIAY